VRRLKTKGSQRDIPLVGASLWACNRLLEANDDSIFAFPRYCNEKTANANSAVVHLNKWLSDYVPEGCVIHSFRHSMRDRLRAVQCPSDIIDQIGGWKTAGVGAWVWVRGILGEYQKMAHTCFRLSHLNQ
jgi:integrase